VRHTGGPLGPACFLAPPALPFSSKRGLVFGIFATIAEFERELIRERVRSGLAVAEARGKHLGRPPSLVDADTVAELHAQGTSWREIAARLGVGVAQRANRC
jgi:DNA invertase Pin-like site-specific DNA recombinase